MTTVVLKVTEGMLVSPLTSKIPVPGDKMQQRKAVDKILAEFINKLNNCPGQASYLLSNFDFEKEIAKNINIENRLSLYSDYINNFGNVDVDCDLTLDLVVNQYVKANIGTRLVYDDDIKSKKEIDGKQVTEGPKTQLKQLLGVGIVYAF